MHFYAGHKHTYIVVELRKKTAKSFVKNRKMSPASGRIAHTLRWIFWKMASRAWIFHYGLRGIGAVPFISLLHNENTSQPQRRCSEETAANSWKCLYLSAKEIYIYSWNYRAAGGNYELLCSTQMRYIRRKKHSMKF